MPSVSVLPGSPLQLGVSKVEQGHNFAIYSRQAHACTLHIYFEPDDASPEIIELNPKANKTGNIWHILLKGLPERFFYSYSVAGPRSPEGGLLFDEQLELIDPYAIALSGLEKWNERRAVRKLLSAYHPHEFDWGDDKPLNRPLSETIIYEMHIRGFTRHISSDVSSPGTYKAVVEKIPYLKALGITAIELLPIHEFDETDCKYINPRTGEKLLNYWGYSSINYFSVKTGYAVEDSCEAARREFKEMVKALHAEGIEIILDVVFNHTAEGGYDRPTLSFKGLDNPTYYLLDEKQAFLNNSGCGNTVNGNHPVVRQMIIQSLRTFVAEMHIDGFRFDLASILTLDQHGEPQGRPPLLEEIAQDPILADTKLIAEPWDATGLYQVGSFPAFNRFAEWNDKYRDLIRRFCRGEPGLTAEVATRISGSEDLYKQSGRLPFHSINHITAHDGFTLYDLVAYEQKHNIENGEENRDGNDNNFSSNLGIEGVTSDPEIIEKRLKQIRNMATVLMLSQGTPMLLAGDEFGNSQFGNNNAWCQDNEVSWLDWQNTALNRELLLFWRKLIAFRQAHPQLNRKQFFTGKINSLNGLPDISWHNTKAFAPDFHQDSRSLAFMINGAVGSDIVDDILFVVMNFSEEKKEFECPLQSTHPGWLEVLDTSRPEAFITSRLQPVDASHGAIAVTSFTVKVMSRPCMGTKDRSSRLPPYPKSAIKSI